MKYKQRALEAELLNKRFERYVRRILIDLSSWYDKEGYRAALASVNNTIKEIKSGKHRHS